MATSRKALVSNDVIQIDPPKTDLGQKCIVQLKLAGGTVSITPTCIVTGSGDLVPADGDGIEYNRPNATATKLTAAISASGIYEFYLDGKSLILTCGAVTGNPILVWNVVNA